jgi:hypothetical protein
MAANKVGASLASVGLLTDVDTSQRNQLGARQQDESNNEYIYMPGLAAMVAGDWVMYSLATFVPTRLVNDASSATAGLVAVSMGAILAANFGWFQIYGVVAVANVATTSSVSFALYRTSTVGRAAVTAVAKDAIYGAFTNAASVANLGSVTIAYPFVMDNSTL